MKYVILIGLPIVVYFGLARVVNYIYFSINEITPNTTMGQIYDGEIASAAILMVIYNMVCGMIREREYSYIFTYIIPLLITVLFVAILPESGGAALLCAILNIAAMIAGGFYASEG